MCSTRTNHKLASARASGHAVRILRARSERTSSILRGEGDAQKNKILGDAYGLDQEFFDFLRTMQACKDTFGDTEMSMVIAPGEVCEKFFGEIDIQN
mgnify:CR=1 FL=1